LVVAEVQVEDAEMAMQVVLDKNSSLHRELDESTR